MFTFLGNEFFSEINYFVAEQRFRLNRKLFYVYRKKRKYKNHEIKNEEILELKNKTELFLKRLKEQGKFCQQDHDVIDKKSIENIEFTNNFYKSQTSTEFINTVGENKSNFAVIHEVNEQKFLFPPNCKFYNKDIRYMDHYLTLEKFDFIVIDPPWKNRYIKRVKVSSSVKQSYSTLDNDEIINIPLENHVSVNSLVVIWCTNSDTHINDLKTKFLPKWDLKILATWYWIKVDKTGELMCPFGDSNMKQPFERLFICTHKDNHSYHEKIKDQELIASVPSTIHSHKPFLLPVFEKFLPENPKCLELFARSLYPNFTSLGTEVLKLQNVLLFEEI